MKLSFINRHLPLPIITRKPEFRLTHNLKHFVLRKKIICTPSFSFHTKVVG